LGTYSIEHFVCGYHGFYLNQNSQNNNMTLPSLENEVTLVSEIMNLTELEQEIYFHMLKEDCTVKELVGVSKRTRSVVQRALQDLMDKNMIVREGRINKTVYYIYKSLPLPDVKKKVKIVLSDWYNSAVKSL